MYLNRRSYKGKDNPFYGKRHSDEAKKKISQAKVGVSITLPTGCHVGEKNPMYGKKHSEFTKQQWSKLRSGKFWQGSLIENHHIDLNKANGNNDNLIRLSKGNHQKLHRRAYDYLVEINLINNYITWFIQKYNPKIYKENGDVF